MIPTNNTRKFKKRFPAAAGSKVNDVRGQHAEPSDLERDAVSAYQEALAADRIISGPTIRELSRVSVPIENREANCRPFYGWWVGLVPTTDG